MTSLGKIIATVEPLRDSQGKIEIYSFGNGFVQIPTEIQSHGYLLHQILGNHSGEDLIVSPNGGTVKNAYYKAIEKLRNPMKSGSYMPGPDAKPAHWNTEEDTTRFWMLKNPEFIRELVNDGWMYFEQFRTMTKEEAVKVGLKDHYEMYRGKVSLDDLTRVLSRPDVNFEKQIKDLSEIRKIVCNSSDQTDFIFKARQGYSNAFYSTEVAHPEGAFRLNLSGIDDFFVKDDTKYLPLKKTLNFNVPFIIDSYGSGVPSWWTEATTDRVLTFAQEYAKVKKMNNYLNLNEKRTQLEVQVNSRNDWAPSKNDLPIVNTQKILEQSVDLRRFIRKAVTLEHHDYTSSQTRISTERRIALGLMVPEVNASE